MVILSIILSLGGIAIANAQESIPVPQLRPLSAPKLQPEPLKAERIYQSACPALLEGLIAASPLPPIIEGACGERSPLSFNAIGNGGNIKLSSSPQVNCRTATAFASWGIALNQAAQAAFASDIATIFTGNGYQCRRRNNLPDGKISEHGFANAIDILGFKLANGDEVNITRDWGEPGEEPTLKSQFLRNLHARACGIFTTVLGPLANEHHKDHFHFDLGCHGKGCTYRVCE